MEENNIAVNEDNTGSEFTASDQTMGSAPEVEQEEVNNSQEEQPVEPSEEDKLRQEKENLREALRQEREERRRYKEELEAVRSQYQQPVYRSPEELERERQLAEARRVLKEELGVMTKDEFEQLTKQEKENWEREQLAEKEREAFNKEVEDLAKEFNGQGGKPKFDKGKLQEYLEYGQKNRIFNLKAIFRDMHFADLASNVAQNPNKPTSFTANSTVSKNSTMPDFSKMTSQQILEWQKSQGLAQH